MEKNFVTVIILCGVLAVIFRCNKWVAMPAVLVGFATGLMALFGIFR
jgi:hypothetical protein